MEPQTTTHEPEPPRARTYGRSRAVRHPEFTYAADELVHPTLCAAIGASFRNAEFCREVCDSIGFYTTKLRYELYAYCLMPDHLHVLLSPANSSVPVSRWLQACRSYTAHASVRFGLRPPLWQRSAHDHVCRKGETAEIVAAYIANNPVRSGLVTRWTDWPWTEVLVDV